MVDENIYLFRKGSGNILYVFFGGINNGFGFAPPFEFLKMTEKHITSPKLFIRDINQDWYNSIFYDVLELLNEQKDKYKRIIYSGVSAGGFGALLFGSYTKPNKIYAFSPQTFLSKKLRKKYNDGRWKNKISALDYLENPILDIRKILKEKTISSKIWVFFCKDKEIDKIHCSMLQGISKNIKTIELNCNTHNSAGVLQEKNKLLESIREKPKIFILGGRSGTSLMLNLLTATKKFINIEPKNWEFEKEPIGFSKIINRTYPNVKKNIFDSKRSFTIAKLPEFDLILDIIVEKFDNCIFIVMDRKKSDILKSYIKNKMVHRCANLFKSNEKFMKILYNRFGKYKNDLNILRQYTTYSHKIRNKFLKNYDQSKILRINYDNFVKDFKNVMTKVCDFLKIKPEFGLWEEIRNKNVKKNRKLK